VLGASTLIYLLASKGLINLVSGALWVAVKVANDKNEKIKIILKGDYNTIRIIQILRIVNN
jgi:hypothetical protein